MSTRSKCDVWNKIVCADDPSSTSFTVKDLLVGFLSCTHLPVYFRAKRTLIWCSKTALQHKPKHSLPVYMPGVHIFSFLSAYWFAVSFGRVFLLSWASWMKERSLSIRFFFLAKLQEGSLCGMFLMSQCQHLMVLQKVWQFCALDTLF